MYDLKALYEAESVAHAIQLLQEHPEAQIIAGGSDVPVSYTHLTLPTILRV